MLVRTRDCVGSRNRKPSLLLRPGRKSARLDSRLTSSSVWPPCCRPLRCSVFWVDSGSVVKYVMMIGSYGSFIERKRNEAGCLGTVGNKAELLGASFSLSCSKMTLHSFGTTLWLYWISSSSLFMLVLRWFCPISFKYYLLYYILFLYYVLMSCIESLNIRKHGSTA